MRKKIKMLTEDCFNLIANVKQLDYGERFDDMWGVGAVEISADDIEALHDGKVLWIPVLGEYCILVRKR